MSSEAGIVGAQITRRIAILPIIQNKEQLMDLLARMAWGIGLASFRDVTVFIADALLAHTPWHVPELMDPAIEANFAALRPRINFVAAATKEQVIEHIEASDFIVFAEDPPHWNILSQEEWAHVIGRKKVLRCDPARTRQEFGNWVELNFHLRTERDFEVEQSRIRFSQIVEEYGHSGTAYCLATGPSLAGFKETNFDGAISIVCNSAILDEELMAWVRPKFLVFADPIFHFGPSSYAAEFRHRLRESCARHSYTIIVPLRYYGLLIDAMPDLKARTIGVPSDKPNGFNLDLSGEFRVFTTANILTYLMLPLASTLAQKIYVIGCDGRPLNEDNYFWQHNKKTQINDQMENIRIVHPGFFAIDYNDYYLDHCRQLEELIREGENMGREYGTVTPSFIPALMDRPANLPRVLIIDFTEIGARNATGQLKATLFQKWPAEKVLQIRPLSMRDGSFFRLYSQSNHPDFTKAKLTRDEVVRECVDFDPQLIYFRPTENSPEFFELGWELVQRIDVPTITHIMDDWPERLRLENPEVFKRIDPILRELLERSALRLSISDAMSVAYRERYGHDFIPIANGVDPKHWKITPSKRADSEPFVLRYCGGLTEDMSLASVERVARIIGELNTQRPIRFEIYALPAALKLAQERFQSLLGVNVFSSVDWKDYPGLLATADALLMAYNFDERTRTYTQFSMANKLPECLASGVPLLVYGPETIATVRRARELGVASLVTEENVETLKGELSRLVLEAPQMRSQALAIRERILAEFDVTEVQRRFHQSIIQLEGNIATREKTLLGPYTRLQRQQVNDCDVAAEFFQKASFANIVLVFGNVAYEQIERFLERGWRVIMCASLSAADRYLPELKAKFGKNAIAVVLCSITEWAQIPPLPIPVAATLIFVSAGEKAPTEIRNPENGLRLVWSGHYLPLVSSGENNYRVLKELTNPADLPPNQLGALFLLDPQWIKTRRGLGDVVTSLRKAFSAALKSSSTYREASCMSGSDRISACIKVWFAAVKGLNVRFNVTQFFKKRIAEVQEIFPSTHSSRLTVWK